MDVDFKMSRRKAGDSAKLQKCSHCSNTVEVSRKGHLISHMRGSTMCEGVGASAERMRMHLQLLQDIRMGRDEDRRTDRRRSAFNK